MSIAKRELVCVLCEGGGSVCLDSFPGLLGGMPAGIIKPLGTFIVPV